MTPPVQPSRTSDSRSRPGTHPLHIPTTRKSAPFPERPSCVYVAAVYLAVPFVTVTFPAFGFEVGVLPSGFLGDLGDRRPTRRYHRRRHGCRGLAIW